MNNRTTINTRPLPSSTTMTVTINNREGSYSTSSLDVSLRTARTTENAPLNRVKHLALNKRHEMYKNLMADVSQVSDGRSMEIMLRRNYSNEDLTLLKKLGNLFGGTDGNNGSSANNTRRSSGDGCSAALSFKKGRRHSNIIDNDLSVTWHPHSLLGLGVADGAMMKPAVVVQPQDGGDPRLPQQREQRETNNLQSEVLNRYLPKRSSRPSAKSSDSSRGSSSSHQSSSRRRSSKDNLLSSSNVSSRKSSGANSDASEPSRRRSTEDTHASSDHSASSQDAVASRSSRSQEQEKKVEGDGSKVTLRKKYQPRHRCPSINDAVTGIVKPPRYTQSPGNNTTASHQPPSSELRRRKSDEDAVQYQKEQEKKAQQKNKASRRRSTPSGPPRELSSSFSQFKPFKNLTIPHLGTIKSTSHSSDDDEDGNTPDYADTSMHSRASLLNESTHSRSSLLNDTSTHSRSSLLNSSMHSYSSTQSWVPLGVDFSANMEVYVFEK